jgi:hypothetical protein
MLREAARRSSSIRSAFERVIALLMNREFKRAVELTSDILPRSLLIATHNRLALLHSALREGMHGKTDAECMEFARTIRLVLTAFATRAAEALKEEAELRAAVGRLTRGE